MNNNGKNSNTGRAETLPVDMIVPSRDNVHAKERKGDETFRGLVESIRTAGLIHRIVVRPEGGKFVIVDGHRRFEAAKAAGMGEVPCEVRELGDRDALAVTVAANVQRLANDPILEAEAIGKMMSAGRTMREIAAAIGKGEGYVARRARLVSLAEPWREFAKRVRCTTDMLEKIAAHETAVQERVAANSGLDDYEDDGGDEYGWSEFEHSFASAMRKLDEAVFDTAGCMKCPANTVCHAFLFDWMATENGNEPMCQDAACFARKSNEVADAVLAELKRAGMPAIEVSNKWAIPQYWGIAEKCDRKHPQAYTFENGGIRQVVWSIPKPKPETARSAMTAEEREAAKIEKRRKAGAKAARNKMRDAIQEKTADIEAFRKWAGSLYGELAARRLDRELGRVWMPDDLVDDIARTWPEWSELCELTADENDALVEELEAEDERMARERIEVTNWTDDGGDE